MVYLEYDRIVRLLVNRHVYTGLTLTLTRQVARIRRDFRPSRAEGSRVAFDSFDELTFRFKVI